MNINRLISLGLISAALGCGGGGGGGSPSSSSPGGNQNPGGIWYGSVYSNYLHASLSAKGAATSAGAFRYSASDDSQGVGQLSVNGSSVSGSGTTYMPDGSTHSLTLTSGQLTTGSSFTGNWSGGGDSGTITFTFDPLYNRPVGLAALAGSYYAPAAQTSSDHEAFVTVSPSGSFTGRGIDGYFSGSLSLVDPAKNLFNASLVYEGDPTTYTGLGFWSDGQSANFISNAVYVQMSSTADQFAAALNKQQSAFGSVNVQNSSGMSITKVYIARHSDPTWGPNLLVSNLGSGGSKLFTNFPAGAYDFACVMSNSSARYLYNFNVQSGSTFTVNVNN